MDEIVPFHMKTRVRRKTNFQIQVAILIRHAGWRGMPLPCQTQARSVPYPGRDRHFQRAGAVAALNGHAPLSAFYRIFERDHHLRFNITPAVLTGR